MAAISPLIVPPTEESDMVQVLGVEVEPIVMKEPVLDVPAIDMTDAEKPQAASEPAIQPSQAAGAKVPSPKARKAALSKRNRPAHSRRHQQIARVVELLRLTRRNEPVMVQSAETPSSRWRRCSSRARTRPRRSSRSRRTLVGTAARWRPITTA